MVSKIFMVGDVHGCFDELILLLKKAKYNPCNHRLILLGDLINKGSDSFKVLCWVKKHKVQAILGNHELKFIKSVEQSFYVSEAIEQLKKDMGDNIKQYISWIKTWPVYIEEKDFLVVHGGVVPNEHPSHSKTEYLVNIRYWGGKGKTMKNPADPPWHQLYTGSKLIVYAHWAKQGLTIKKNSIGLDTACVYGGKLTGMWFPEKTFVQVQSIKSGRNQ